MSHPFADPVPSLALAGRGERRYPKLICSRCHEHVGILVSDDDYQGICIACFNDLAPRTLAQLEGR